MVTHTHTYTYTHTHTHIHTYTHTHTTTTVTLARVHNYGMRNPHYSAMRPVSNPFLRALLSMIQQTRVARFRLPIINDIAGPYSCNLDFTISNVLSATFAILHKNNINKNKKHFLKEQSGRDAAAKKELIQVE